jgi:hypothetical protein
MAGEVGKMVQVQVPGAGEKNLLRLSAFCGTTCTNSRTSRPLD